MSATMRSSYSQAQIVENNLTRRMYVSTPMGSVSVVTSAGELPAIVVTHDMIGSAALPLDDNAIEALSYELARYLANKRQRTKVKAQGE